MIFSYSVRKYINHNYNQPHAVCRFEYTTLFSIKFVFTFYYIANLCSFLNKNRITCRITCYYFAVIPNLNESADVFLITDVLFAVYYFFFFLKPCWFCIEGLSLDLG